MIDDGSTDGSSLIAQSYADKDARFEYYRKQNGGLSDARKFWIRKTDGRVCSFYLMVMIILN